MAQLGEWYENTEREIADQIQLRINRAGTCAGPCLFKLLSCRPRFVAVQPRACAILEVAV
jgi:hypothetical protein